jgi:hypothetical protein
MVPVSVRCACACAGLGAANRTLSLSAAQPKKTTTRARPLRASTTPARRGDAAPPYARNATQPTRRRAQIVTILYGPPRYTYAGHGPAGSTQAHKHEQAVPRHVTLKKHRTPPHRHRHCPTQHIATALPLAHRHHHRHATTRPPLPPLVYPLSSGVCLVSGMLSW